MKTVEEYLNSSSHCPKCDSTNINAGEKDISGNNMYQDIHCDSCGLTWIDEYTLTGYSIAKEKK